MKPDYKYLLGLSEDLNKAVERQCSRLQQAKSAFIRDCLQRRLAELSDDSGTTRDLGAGRHIPNGPKAYWIGFFKRLFLGTVMITIGMLIRMTTH